MRKLPGICSTKIGNPIYILKGALPDSFGPKYNFWFRKKNDVQESKQETNCIDSETYLKLLQF